MGYTMEQMLHFVECYSTYIFFPIQTPSGPEEVLPPPLLEMWGCLRTAVLHYMRPGDFSLRARKRAREALRTYGRLAEQHGLPDTYFRFNHHMLTCRCAGVGLGERAWLRAWYSSTHTRHTYNFAARATNARRLFHQEAARGYVAYNTEFVLERTMQEFKKLMRNRGLVANVETTVAIEILQRDTLDALARAFPELRSLDTPHVTAPPRVCDPDGGGGVQVLGAGRLVRVGGGAARAQLDQEVMAFLQANPELGGWDDQVVSGARVWRAQRASLRTAQHVHAASYGRATTRVSSFVMLGLECGTIVHVLEFLLVKPENLVSPLPLRLARVQLYKTGRRHHPHLGTIWRTSGPPGAPILIDACSIESAMAGMFPSKVVPRAGEQPGMFFLKYHSTTHV